MSQSVLLKNDLFSVKVVIRYFKYINWLTIQIADLTTPSGNGGRSPTPVLDSSSSEDESKKLEKEKRKKEKENKARMHSEVRCSRMKWSDFLVFPRYLVWLRHERLLWNERVGRTMVDPEKQKMKSFQGGNCWILLQIMIAGSKEGEGRKEGEEKGEREGLEECKFGFSWMLAPFWARMTAGKLHIQHIWCHVALKWATRRKSMRPCYLWKSLSLLASVSRYYNHEILWN